MGFEFQCHKRQRGHAAHQRRLEDIHIPVRSLMLVAIAACCAGAEDLEAAKQLYLKAVEGDERALKEAAGVLDGLRREHPHDARVAAYLGSSRLLESSHTMAPWKKGKLAKEGLERLDAAVRMAPGDAEIRFLRAASTFHLPGWFGRGVECEQDLRLLSAPEMRTALGPRYAAAALYYHGVMREKAGDTGGAREAWGESVRLSPDTRAGREAANKLGRR